MKIVVSVSGVPIRLTPERWNHITLRHTEMRDQEEKILQTITEPDYVQAGDGETLIAIKRFSETPLTEKFCSVVYKELTPYDGFVITAYFTWMPNPGRKLVWKP